MNCDSVEQFFYLKGYTVLEFVSSSKGAEYYLLVKSDDNPTSESEGDKTTNSMKLFAKSVIIKKNNAKRKLGEVATIVSLGNHAV